ncbi:polysaccharide export outer membrane protein [Paraburkholderia sp. RAU2J]|nr:polysaccharide export outer membrane protein [Paraburkholderia sp. RAU2J]
MFAPGMGFDASRPVDPGDPNSFPIVTPITVALIQRDLLDSRERVKSDDSYTPLVGKPKPYRIGPQDVLSIIVWDHPELVMPNLTYDVGGGMAGGAGMASQVAPGFIVDDRGYVQFPYVKQLRAAGLSEQQLQRVLIDRLAPVIPDPQVSVRVVGFRSQKAYVDGEVRNPGVKPVTDVPSTLAELLNQANGIPPTGDPSRIQLTRGSVTYRIDLPQMRAKGLSLNDIVVENGDVIRVPPLAEHRVIVMGEVGKQSPVPFRTDGRLSLSDALGDAGGVSQVTGDASEIYVIRRNVEAALPIVYHLDSKSPSAMSLASGFQLQADDVVYVGAPGVIRWDRFITPLLGSTTGAYYLQRTARGN